jgi:hypothetical protein
MSSGTTIREPWERRTYGSDLAKRAMAAYTRRLKAINQAAHPKRTETMRKKRDLAA